MSKEEIKEKALDLFQEMLDNFDVEEDELLNEVVDLLFEVSQMA